MALVVRTKYLLLALLLTACGGASRHHVAKGGGVAVPRWQTLIGDADRKRLAGLWDAWTRSLAQAKAQGDDAAVMALGPVAVPDAARAAAFPAPGAYRCRSVRLGLRDVDGVVRPGPAVSASAFAPCRMDAAGGALRFEQSAGTQRVAGRLFPDGDRMVFLGAMALAQEHGVMAYGADGDRDQVGVLRAYGEGRWRLELPWPKWQSNLELIEILPG